MADRDAGKTQLRQTFLQEYLNPNTFRSPRKDFSANRPIKKSCVNKLTPEFAKAKLRGNNDQENTYETSESYHVPVQEALAFSNKTPQILSEANLRRHTIITKTADENKKFRTLTFVENTEKEHRSKMHVEQIKLRAEQFQRAYQNEKMAVDKRKKSIQRRHEKYLSEMLNETKVSQYLSYLSSFYSFCHLKNFSLSYVQRHALAVFLKHDKVIFGHGIFMGKAVTSMAAAYCVYHHGGYNIFMLAHKERHSDLEKQFIQFNCTFIKLIGPDEIATLNELNAVGCPPCTKYMLIAIDFLSIARDPQYQSDFFHFATCHACEKFIGTCSALYEMKETSVLPGNVYRPSGDVDKFITAIIPCLKLTSKRPKKYQYNEDFEPATSTIKREVLSIIKKYEESMHKQTALHAQKSEIENDQQDPKAKLKRRNEYVVDPYDLIEFAYKYYKKRIIIKSRKDKMIRDDPYFKARNRIERWVNLAKADTEKYDKCIFSLNYSGWNSKSLEAKRLFMTKMDTMCSMAKLPSIQVMISYASMRGHSVLIMSKYDKVLGKLHEILLQKGHSSMHLRSMTKEALGTDFDSKEEELQTSLMNANASEQKAAAYGDKVAENDAHNEANKIMKQLDSLERTRKIAQINLKVVHSLCLENKIVLSTYSSIRPYSYMLRERETPFVFLIDRPYTSNDVKLCENHTTDDGKSFKSTAIWIQSSPLDTYIDSTLKNADPSDEAASTSTKSWLDDPDKYFVPILNENLSFDQ